MYATIKSVLITFLCIFVGTACFAQTAFEKGLIAFDKKDYQTSFAALHPFAEQGNCTAQYVIGFSYAYGLSVTKNDSLARKWLKLAAEQKKTNAMGPLAVNMMGSEEPEAMIKAYMWAMLAAEYVPAQRMTSARYVIKSYLKPEELSAAERLISAYKAKWKKTEDCY
jgi:TPR repeat protein